MYIFTSSCGYVGCCYIHTCCQFTVKLTHLALSLHKFFMAASAYNIFQKIFTLLCVQYNFIFCFFMATSFTYIYVLDTSGTKLRAASGWLHKPSLLHTRKQKSASEKSWISFQKEYPSPQMDGRTERIKDSIH